MRRLSIALPLLLAACDGAVTLTNAAIPEVATATAGVEKPEPGQWSSAVTLVAFDAGGADTPAAQLLRGQVGDTVTTEACLTPEDARRPLFGDVAPIAGATCTFTRFILRGGRLDALMACRNARGERLEVRQQGGYTPDAVDLQATVRRFARGGKPAGGMTTRIVAHRTGDCEEDDT
jgi:hypothetical protein